MVDQKVTPPGIKPAAKPAQQSAASDKPTAAQVAKQAEKSGQPTDPNPTAEGNVVKTELPFVPQVNRPPVVDDEDSDNFGGDDNDLAAAGNAGKVQGRHVSIPQESAVSSPERLVAEAEGEPVISPTTRAEMDEGRKALAGSRKLSAADRDPSDKRK